MIYDRYVAAWDNLNIDVYLACIHDDYEITFHAVQRVIRLEEFSNQIGSMMVSAKFENRRLKCVNEDIIVTHSITMFSDGSREADLQFTPKKDGLLW